MTIYKACNNCGKSKADCECCIECGAFAEDGNVKHKSHCSEYVAPKRRTRGPAKLTKPESVRAPVEKRKRAISDKEIGRIAVDLFNGKTTMAKTAKQLGISASYLSRLLKDADKRGVFRYSVAKS